MGDILDHSVAEKETAKLKKEAVLMEHDLKTHIYHCLRYSNLCIPMYSHLFSYDATQREMADLVRQTVLSNCTISNWFQYCRETVVEYELHNREQRPLIGGTGKIIKIKETKLGRKIYSNGRQVEGHCVLGIGEDDNDDLRVEMCPVNERSAEVLVQLIKKHVREGFEIHTDLEGADCLSEHGYIYIHLSVEDGTQ